MFTSFIMSDDKRIELSEKVNKQYFPYWSPENPKNVLSDHFIQKSDCGVARFGIILPCFLLNDIGNAVNVSSERYVAIPREL